jgi:hypothetical protein
MIATPDGRVLLTSKEAAALLRVSVDTLYGMSVPYLTIGHGRKRPRRRYLRETLLQWAKQRESA